MRSAAVRLVALACAACALGGADAQASPKLVFGSLGDWGLPAKQQAAVMGPVLEQHGMDFLLAVGDNFYEYGVKSVDDPQWKTTFEDVYTAPVFQKPWLVIEGNHDHRGNVSAQIAYTQMSHRWYLPNLWYTTLHKIGNSSATLQIVHIDTIVLAGAWDHGKMGQKQPIGPKDVSAATEQLKWIKTTLQSSTATWLVVVGHYPVYSVGEHGSTQYLIDNILPLMHTAKVAMYIDGHDHGMQHNSDGQMEFFVSGAGAKSADQDVHSLPKPANSVFAWPKDHTDEGACMLNNHEYCYGFMVFEATPTTLMAYIYSSTNGKMLHSVSVSNPRA